MLPLFIIQHKSYFQWDENINIDCHVLRLSNGDKGGLKWNNKKNKKQGSDRKKTRRREYNGESNKVNLKFLKPIEGVSV